jgi:hypothetical protein
MAKTLNGVKVGPLDPDVTRDFGTIAKGRTARQLLNLQRRMHPLELTNALRKKYDEPRSQALDFDEIEAALAGEIPDGCEIVGANVRGQRDRDKILTYTLRTPSGRTVKWFTEYDAERFPASVEAGDEATAVAQARERGLPAQMQSHHARSVEVENARLRRKLQDLQAAVEGRVAPGAAVEEDDREELSSLDEELSVDEARDRADQAERDAAASAERIAELEAQLAAANAALSGGGAALTGADDQGGDEGPLDEPWEGYDGLTIDDVKSHLSGIEDDEERAEVARTAYAYEEASTSPRSSLLSWLRQHHDADDSAG